MIASSIPANLEIQLDAVMPFCVPAILKSMSP